MTIKISVVIPVFNEAEAIITLIKKIDNVLSRNYRGNFEVLLVDDGSSDNTEEVLAKEKTNFSWLKIITLARNYGQSTALQAGFDFSRTWLYRVFLEKRFHARKTRHFRELLIIHGALSTGT